MSVRKCLVGLAAAVLVLTCGSASAQRIVFQNTFDEDPTDALPPDWEIVRASGGSTALVDDFGLSGKSLHFRDSGGEVVIEIREYFSPERPCRTTAVFVAHVVHARQVLSQDVV